MFLTALKKDKHTLDQPGVNQLPLDEPVVDCFPVIYSTLDSQALRSKILTQFAIGDVFDCQFWHRGLSDVYLVHTRVGEQVRPYVLRVSHHHWRSRPEIEFELKLLNFLVARDIPVAAPVPNIEGDYAVEIRAPEGSRYASLFFYAPGQVPLGDLNPVQGKCLGETVARLHQATQNFHCNYERPDLSLEYLVDESLAAIAPFLQHRSQDLAFLDQSVQQLKSQLIRVPKEYPFWGICWGDPHSGNVHFTEDNRPTLFDFDQCGYGWRAFDLGKFLQVSVRAGLSQSVRAAFVEGYKSIRELTALELECIPAFTQTAHLWNWAISATTAKIHQTCQLDDGYFTHRLEQLKRLNSPDWKLF